MADANNLDIAEMVVRRSTRYQQMSADERHAADMRFADFMDEEMDEEVDFAALGNEREDDDDCTYQPAEESDAENEGYVEINEDIDEDDDEEEEEVWWLCDSKSYYPVKGMIYSGKLPNQEREVNQGQNVVLELAEKYLDAGRTIYADNFFTTLDLARILMRRNTAYVGTVRYNKTFVPQELKRDPKRAINSTLFGFNEGDIALCSYVPKKNKVVNVLSTMHYTCRVGEQNEKRKPFAILDYNNNKCGVDTMDQMLGTHTCKRSTNRWPLAMFYNMLDVAALAAFTIYNEMKPMKRSDRRRSFLLLLTKQLATPNIEESALNSRITAYPRICNAIEAFGVRMISRSVEADAPSFAARKNRPSCRLCRSEYGRQRKTRAYCFGCGNAICGELSTVLHRCNTCAQGGE